MYLLARKARFPADLMFKKHQGRGHTAVIRGYSGARSIAGGWSTGVLRPIAGAPQACTWPIRRIFDLGDAAGQGRVLPRGGLLRPAVAVLGHAGNNDIPAPTFFTIPQLARGKDRWAGTFRGPFRGRTRGRSLPDGTTVKVNLLAEGSLLRSVPRSRTEYPEFNLWGAQEARLGRGSLTPPRRPRS